MTPADRREAVRQFVCSHGTTGVSISRVMAQFNVRNTTAGGDLRALHRAGLIEPSHPRGGTVNRWGAIGTQAAWQAAVDANYARNKAKRDRLAKISSDIESFARPSVIRCIPASDAPLPIFVSAPMSVFNLGASA